MCHTYNAMLAYPFWNRPAVYDEPTCLYSDESSVQMHVVLRNKFEVL